MISQLGLGTPYMISHTFQHLKSHVLRASQLPTQQIGVCNSEQIMRSDPHMQGFCILR